MSEIEMRVSFRAPGHLVQEAKDKAKTEDVTLSQVMRWHLRAWVRGELPTRPPNPKEACGVPLPRR